MLSQKQGSRLLSLERKKARSEMEAGPAMYVPLFHSTTVSLALVLICLFDSIQATLDIPALVLDLSEGHESLTLRLRIFTGARKLKCLLGLAAGLLYAATLEQ